MGENSSKSSNKKINKYFSKYACVHYVSKYNKFRASITFDGHKIHIGYFYTEEEAARAVNQKCLELGIPIKNPTI